VITPLNQKLSSVTAPLSWFEVQHHKQQPFILDNMAMMTLGFQVASNACCVSKTDIPCHCIYTCNLLFSLQYAAVLVLC
jgi:hypothetical protein